MDNSKLQFGSELHVSPHIVLSAFITLGVIVYFVSDSVVDGAQLLQFSFILLVVGGGVWLLQSYLPKTGPWLTIAAFYALIFLADLWLRLPDSLYFMSIPIVLAMGMLGFRGAMATTIPATLLLLLIPYWVSEGRLGEVGRVMAMSWILLGILYVWHWRSSQLLDWSWGYYQYSQSVLESARNERMEHKQLEADLVLANQELARLSSWLKSMHQLAEEARQTKERFVANVSHELRTPLNMIIGFSEIISRSSSVYGIKLPPALLVDIDAIQRNSQHLSKLVDDVLDLAQIESDRMVISKEWSSMAAIVGQACAAVEALFASKKLYLRTDIPDTLDKIYCDSTRIRQVLINLLSNAGRFTQAGGVCITVQQNENSIVVSVSDTGHGIAPEDQRRLFEPFYQVDSSLRRSYGGSGLGLSISKQLVEMHRGKMWLESEVGVGTTFHFGLPLHPPLPTYPLADGPRYNPYAQFDGRVEQSKAPVPKLVPRYVVMEEGNNLQRMLTRYQDNIEVVSVASPAEALEELNRSPARALILNSTPLLPVQSAPSLLTKLPYSTPVIRCWVTGESSSSYAPGVTRHLVKPVTSELLLSTLADLGTEIETVLLVDDDREFLRLFTRMLGSAPTPYRVLQTTSGERALTLLRERRPDVMLLDLMMPKMDGFQVLEQKQQDPQIADIPVIVISAQDPNGQPIVSHYLTVSYQEGFSAPNLLACIQALSEALSPRLPSAGQAQPEMQRG
jgi:signal transduction histidine kinase/CheY-like chemotaxis protein